MVVIRGHNIMVISSAAIVADDLKVVILNVVTLCISLISIRVSLVGPFMLLFIISINTNLVIVTILARVVIILLGVYFFGYFRLLLV